MAVDTRLKLALMSPLQAEIARKIAGFIQDGRWAVGDRISDAALSKELGTSRTPVRQVLQILCEQGLVAQSPKAGFHLNRTIGRNADLDTLIPPSDTEALFTSMMMARANGTIGDEASEAELADQFSVTRGAVRRALMRFSSEGLAERRPGHGWRFAECLDNRQAVEESYAYRILIECGAVCEKSFRPNTDELSALRAQQEKLSQSSLSDISRADWFEANANFHATVVSWSQNRYLLQSIRRQNSLRRMTEYAEFTQLSEERIHRAARDHLAILDAIEAGDCKLASAILYRHLSRTALPAEVPGEFD